MGPQRRLGIYVGFDSPSIIRYIEPMTGDLFTARFADCHFDETVFPSLGGENKARTLPKDQQELTWHTPALLFFDPKTGDTEREVQKIIHMQQIANQIPDAFTDANKVVKSHIPAVNVPARIEIPKVGPVVPATDDSKIRLKRGRPIGAKDTAPRKIKEKANNDMKKIAQPSRDIDQEPNVVDQNNSLEETVIPDNEEVSICYTYKDTILYRNRFEIDEKFVYNVALDIEMNNDFEPQSVDECRQRKDWPKWKEAIEAELRVIKYRDLIYIYITIV